MSEPKVIRWGILATGGIAQTFSKDLLVDPKTRGVTSIKHTIVAAASSSGLARATQFLKDVGAPSDAKPYGSYEEFVKDPNIDVVYISTPHSHHYQNTMLVLEAGKNVIVEKAFTVNAAQARKLTEKAKEKVRLVIPVYRLAEPHLPRIVECVPHGSHLDAFLPRLILRPRHHHFRQDWNCPARHR